MDREARGGSLHGFRTWCQPSNKLTVYGISRCHRAWKLYMQPDILKSGRSGGVLHVSWTCSQPCGARGAAAHASGAMRSDTLAATNLKLIAPRDGSVQLNSPRPLSSFDDQLEMLSGVSSVLRVQISRSSARYSAGSPKNCPEARGDSVRVQISLSRSVSIFMVKPRLCPRHDQSSPLQSLWEPKFALLIYV
ncbi:hypothetical protein DY000_02030130 [Brassica cretica]|uniref:Uncharacterized protein n=1 Tax=Brassica cretica TaxID=69181 RepID=A0ABQ7DWD8_BRACR|nr:hypothetical protein DY000_02030130 [Brassica cretica]